MEENQTHEIVSHYNTNRPSSFQHADRTYSDDDDFAMFQYHRLSDDAVIAQ